MSAEPDKRFTESLSAEYYRLVGIVSDFDKNLLTVKGWGVTLGLAALAWGFEKQHYGLFLVAALSGVAFWTIEAVMKRHQMRYYVRMREIEVIGAELSQGALQDKKRASSPLIDWSWQEAPGVFAKGGRTPLPPVEYGSPNPYTAYAWAAFFPHVFLPHLITALAGGVLFVLGCFTDKLKNMPL